jgi:hypothetical protein
MTNRGKSESGAPAAMVAAISHVLRPLARLLLANGITLPTFCELAKSAYVKIADDEFRLASKPQTDSRVSLLTGIHRREVNRLRNEPEAQVDLSQPASMSAHLLAIWSGSAEYLDQRGSPIPLPRLATKGAARSFESLVQSVSKDFRPRVVLDEWLRQGIVTVDDMDRVHLSADAFVQPQGIEEKLYYFGQNAHDHLAATVHNLAGGEPPFLERCVFYDKLSPESVQELTDYSREIAMTALHAVNKRAADLQMRDQGKPEAVYRSNFGVYSFNEKEAANDTPEN